VTESSQRTLRRAPGHDWAVSTSARGGDSRRPASYAGRSTQQIGGPGPVAAHQSRSTSSITPARRLGLAACGTDRASGREARSALTVPVARGGTWLIRETAIFAALRRLQRPVAQAGGGCLRVSGVDVLPWGRDGSRYSLRGLERATSMTSRRPRLASRRPHAPKHVASSSAPPRARDLHCPVLRKRQRIQKYKGRCLGSGWAAAGRLLVHTCRRKGGIVRVAI